MKEFSLNVVGETSVQNLERISEHNDTQRDHDFVPQVLFTIGPQSSILNSPLTLFNLGGSLWSPFEFFSRISAMKTLILKLLDFYLKSIGYIVIKISLSIAVSRDLYMPFVGDQSQRKS